MTAENALPSAAAAARNNAAWCDLMTRLHGGTGRFTPCAWTSPRRTPPFYPDAVTLAPGTSPLEFLPLVDGGPGCSVKDSFADVDLAPHGFEILFRAQWIAAPAPVPDATAQAGWRHVAGTSELADWAAAWGETEHQIFLPSLLPEPDVAVLWNGLAGGIVNLTAGVAGVSNVFTGGSDPVRVWHELLGFAATLFPGLPFVGYEQGEDLNATLHAGFQVRGDLRVWLHSTESPRLWSS